MAGVVHETAVLAAVEKIVGRGLGPRTHCRPSGLGAAGALGDVR